MFVIVCAYIICTFCIAKCDPVLEMYVSTVFLRVCQIHLMRTAVDKIFIKKI